MTSTSSISSTSLTSSTTLNALNNINTKINKIFKNPNINFFIMMNIILLISCYTFINTPLKNTISSFISNPIIVLFSLILIIIIGYHNINIAILSLLLLFVVLFGSTLNTNANNNILNKKHNMFEGFSNDDDDDDDDDNDNDVDDDVDNDTKQNKLIKQEAKFEKKIKENKIKSREDNINSVKNVILGGINKLTSGAENEYKKGLLENKQIIYENEKKNNIGTKKLSKNNTNTKKSSGKSSIIKDEFQTVETRAFDPTNEDDTNLLITKEVLQDMINRIEYKFETNAYLKKYLKHRIEEIVDLNKLVEWEDD
jgi:hypothetical protein